MTTPDGKECAMTKRLRSCVTAIIIGLRDGWRQPHQLNWSTNLEYLGDPEHFARIQDLQDGAISVGQLARAGTSSQAWEEGYWPVAWLRQAR